MLRTSLLIFSILCAAILIGCSKTEMGNSNSMADNSISRWRAVELPRPATRLAYLNATTI